MRHDKEVDMINAIRMLHKALDICSKSLCSVCRVVLVISLFGIVLDLGAGSIMRYTIKYIPSWYEELAKFFLIWLAFSGSVIAMERGDHSSLDIYGKCSCRFRAAMRLIAHVLLLFTAVMVCSYGWRFAQGGWLGVFSCMDFMHLFYGYVSVPVCFFGVGLIAVRNILAGVVEIATGEQFSGNAAGA